MFYVYEWFIVETNEVIYVGKGCRQRYKVRKHNRLFNEMINCDSRIIKYFDIEKEAFKYEFDRINELKNINQCVCNICQGGTGGTVNWWTGERKQWYSDHNCMKSKKQRKRMSINNPMKNKNTAQIVGKKHQRKVVINGDEVNSVIEASKKFNVNSATICNWCKRGYDTYGNPCRYYDENQKDYPKIKKTHPKATNLKAVLIDGLRFETVKDGASYIGVWSETLIKAIKNNKLCKGHICKYDNQQPSTNLKD